MCLPTNCLSVFVCVGRLAIDLLFASPSCLSVFIYIFLRRAWFNLSLRLSVHHLFMNLAERITCVSVCLSPCKSVFSSDCLYVSGHDLNSYLISLSTIPLLICLSVSPVCLCVCLCSVCLPLYWFVVLNVRCICSLDLFTTYQCNNMSACCMCLLYRVVSY